MQQDQDSGFFSRVTGILPFIGWFKNYNLSIFRVDFISGLTVALVLIPQSMAYAQLAGLPAYYGLYAAFLPPMVASLFGSSYQLATGPVAVVSLMTATALEPLATAGSESYIAYAILLAVMVGVFQFSLGVLRLGLVVNFLSHPVVNGFTNAAAIIIASSQFSKLFGVYVDKAEHHYETIFNVVKAAIDYTHWPTLGMAVLAIAIMSGIKRTKYQNYNVLAAVVITTLLSWGTGFENNHKADISFLDPPGARSLVEEYNEALDLLERRSDERVQLGTDLQEAKKNHGPESPEFMVLDHEMSLTNIEIKELKEEIKRDRTSLRSFKFSAAAESDGVLRFYFKDQFPPEAKKTGKIWRIKVGQKFLDESALTIIGGGAIVAKIRKGLPKLGIPKFDFGVMFGLLPMVVIISLLGFMEAISIAKAMAAKTGQRLDPNQELIGQGLANIIGAVGRSYPVSGSFSRSAVNLQAGAVTGLSNVISSCIVIITLLFFTPLLYHLPQSVLASIIMMAVIGLVNVKGFIHAWQAQRHDGIVAIISFVATLLYAPHLDRGIFIGVILTLGFYLYRTMKPEMALLAKYTDGSFRNAERFNLGQCQHIAVIRFNGSLFFANVSYLEEQILEEIALMPELKHVLIVGNGINELDASGEDMLSIMVDRVREAGYEISISGLNDRVLDVLRRTHLYDKIGEENLYRSVAMAMEDIYERTHSESEESTCPLVKTTFKGMPVSSKLKRRPEITEGPKEEKEEQDKKEE